MQVVKRLVSVLALIAVLGVSGGAAVAATQYPVQGGTWNYGLAAGVRAYSDYKVDKCHGTTVRNDWGNSRSIDVAPNKWANSAIRATVWTNNEYFFRVC